MRECVGNLQIHMLIIADTHQLCLENQSSFWWNHRCPSLLSVGEVVWNSQSSLVANTHIQKALVPSCSSHRQICKKASPSQIGEVLGTFDDATLPQSEGERHTAVYTRVELGAIRRKSTGVVNLNFISIFGSSRCKSSEHGNQPVATRGRPYCSYIPQSGASYNFSILRSSAATRPMRKSDRKEPILIFILGTCLLLSQKERVFVYMWPVIVLSVQWLYSVATVCRGHNTQTYAYCIRIINHLAAKTKLVYSLLKQVSPVLGSSAVFF